MLNVILDASPLGIGFYHRQAKTGVSRVVEELVRGLWQHRQVHLSLAAPAHLAETMRYARQQFPENTSPFVNPVGDQLAARLENTLLRPFDPQSLPSKVIRQVGYQTRRVLNREEARFRVAQLPERAIYHSPFYPIPATIGRDTSVRTVQMIHDLIPIFHPEWFPDKDSTVRQVLAALPPTAHIVTASLATKHDFCEYTGINPAHVTPIHLAASRVLFHPVTDAAQKQAVRATYGLGDAPYLLSLATFEPRKNTDHLIRCFVQAARSNAIPPDVKLVLVGTRGWKFDNILDELARSETMRSRLIVTGFVPDEHLAPLYADAVAFLYPSLYEGFGLPPLEALQCGLPVITSNIAAIREVVGDAAICVAPTDADALTQAIVTVVNSETTRADLSAKAIRRASQFSWDKFIAEHVALYERL